ncbi:MAG: hypothetical protein CBB92_00230 [Flammeovirgaceae bacterium TMED32]|nr:MAG: hypothetical protein CBB92_00230 [Flammeovirgaceae bacterium TMED32]
MMKQQHSGHPDGGFLTITVTRSVIIVLSLIIAPPAFSDWQLRTEYSVLSFTSVKNGTITESHQVSGLTGFVSQSGIAAITINLSSVETGIPIRNERMQKLLFEITQYPHAIFSSKVNIQEFNRLSVGQTTRSSLEGQLAMHGHSANLNIPVLVNRSGEGTFIVNTVKPIVVSADQFDLGNGVEALREIAGLANITPTVPVSFTLVFAKTDQE